MRSLKQNLVSEIFVVATGFAALIHSTWSIGTLFSGNEPVWTADLWASAWAYLSWMIPALLIAFALDIGQIATSHEIRMDLKLGKRPIAKYITFGIFALATYYLQWLYMAHHVPKLALGEGVGATHVQFASFLRDLSIWIVPAFLPLSTLLYTISRVKTEEVIAEIVVEDPQAVFQITQPLLPERSGRKRVAEEVKAFILENPDKKPKEVAENLSVGISTVYRIMKEIEHD